MITICLVEDEEYALKSLHQKIIDLGGPYNVVGTAYNGIDAIDVISRLHPDVVITDIRMPDMDGLALIEQLNKQNISITSVIISGYQEFEYAKNALKLGVEDYLLKPVASNELKECLVKCEEKVSRKRNDKHIDDILSENIPICWEDAEYFLIYIIFGNAVSGFESIVHPNVFYIPSLDIERKFMKIFVCLEQTLCFIGLCSNEKVIITPRGNMSENIYYQKLCEFAADLEKEHKYTVTISYRLTNKSKLIGTQIDICRNIAVQNVLLGRNNIVSKMQTNNYSVPAVNDVITYLSLFIRQGQHDHLKSKLRELFAEWDKNHYPLRAAQNDLIYITNSLRYSFPGAESYEFTISYYIENIVSISNSYADLADCFFYLLLELFGTSSATGDRAVSPAQLVEQIELYFRNNLSNNLTLSMICSEMNYSKVYLCRVFKKIKNTTPIDYFIQMKIEKAKAVFKQYPSMTVKDIADSLGFNDVYYFSKVFKRITGQTPSAVREQVTATI